MNEENWFAPAGLRVWGDKTLCPPEQTFRRINARRLAMIKPSFFPKRAPVGPCPFPPVKRSIRAQRRYRGKLRASGWAAHLLAVSLSEALTQSINRQGFMQRMIERDDAAQVGVE